MHGSFKLILHSGCEVGDNGQGYLPKQLAKWTLHLASAWQSLRKMEMSHQTGDQSWECRGVDFPGGTPDGSGQLPSWTKADGCYLLTWRQVGFLDLQQPDIFENSEVVLENSHGFRTASAFLSVQLQKLLLGEC